MIAWRSVTLSIAVIGSGFAGLLIGIKLKRAGLNSFTIYEKSDRIGGTWRDNVYPGAACDVPAHLYSYSFEPKPDWPRKFAEQPDILAYQEHCARKYGLLPHLRLGVEIAEAEFDEQAMHWRLRSTAGERLTAQILISACGQLNRPAYPAIPGLQRFAGAAFHSARWRHDVPLAGRRVAVIGTGASAIQFVPPVAAQAASLAIFQRSPPWIMPKPDRIYGAAEKALYGQIPALQALQRQLFYAYFETSYYGLRTGSPVNRVAQWLGARHLRKSIPDERLRRLLTPDYPAGCKRILISNDYYPALLRPGVSVVTEPLVEARPEGLLTRDGTLHAADVLIYGTGFRTTEFLAPMRVLGRSGCELGVALKEGAAAYLGISVPRFPNLFFLYGPNTNLGHNSVLIMMEAQARYILSALDALRTGGLRYLDVKEEPRERFRQELEQRLRGSVWSAGCTSWYKSESGVQTNNWPGPTWEYRRRTRRINLQDYETG